jgi:predicted nucleic acid-binding protein
VKLFFGIDVVLDVILRREPWAAEAALLLIEVEEKRADGFIANDTVSTVHYIVAKARDSKAAATAVTDLLRIVSIVPLGDADFQQALVLELAQFEDAVQAAAALSIGADYLVTRNAKDFRGIPIYVRSAGEVLALMEPAASGGTAERPAHPSENVPDAEKPRRRR